MLDRDTRQRVLEAAGPIFAARGFDAVTIREICKQAGANVSAVNYHFRSKEQLYVETVRHAHESITEKVPLPTFEPGTPPEERLRRFLRTMLERFERGGSAWHCELIMREVSQPTAGGCAEFVRGFVRPTHEMLMSILNDLLPPDVPLEKRMLLTMSVIGQCLHYHHSRNVLPLLAGPEAAARLRDATTWADHVTDFSLAALRRLYPRPAL
jgi:AcrR family transcriptional regulator